MYVLGIESSCDETAAAVVADGHRVLSNVIASQIAVHRPFGGVVPELASRHHLVNVIPVIRQALTEATQVDELCTGLAALDAVAVTVGPGLVGALMVGLQAAKGICVATGLPIVGVNHLDAHLEAVQAGRGETNPGPTFPHVALLVSGGHTLLLLVRKRGHYELLGSTRDDAAGEAFDKVAKMLGLAYPGGPAISRAARKGDPAAVHFPRALRRRGELDMSFSGLKTAVRLYLEKNGRPRTDAEMADICASVEEAVVDVLVSKLTQAVRSTGVSQLVIAGGVAANKRLRGRVGAFARAEGLRVSMPDAVLCTDNAVMTAVAGTRRFLEEGADSLDLDARARWLPAGRDRGSYR
ncbi:MAG: tRNA (adenosine(37)-N6)-threonylcarbamoyltransferase complex transferase subunit TsaD [Deltaproteobacteria bacterium]|nr:tRNA (adenosine(37)-N6)-threonylcarbamoyltransferase complex transferase subunit TsaD [Deltaproteobacteria bacterium]